MSWFLSRKKKGKGRRKSHAATARTSRTWNPQRTLAGLKALTVVTVVVLLGWAWMRGEPYLKQYATQNAMLQAAQAELEPAKGGASPVPVEVELVDAPAWLHGSPLLRQQICDRVSEQIGPDPLDARDLNWAVAALRDCPWVASVTRIERTSLQGVRVFARYREPFAVIEARDGYHLVDSQGVRLLREPYGMSDPARGQLPVVVGVRAAPCPVGQVWPGDEVQAGLKLLSLLRDRPYLDQVEAIDVAQRDRRDRLNLVIVARNGGTVQWGLPPGQEQPIQRDAAYKLAGLDEMYRKYGKIAESGKVVTISGEAVMFEVIHR